MKNNGSAPYLIIATLLVIAAVVFGLATIDAPSQARARRSDERRVEDLASIQYQIEEFYREHKKVPQTLAELVRVPTDPANGASYDYQKGNGLEYNLCATFVTDNKTSTAQNPYEGRFETEWLHGAGHACFVKEVPPYPGD